MEHFAGIDISRDHLDLAIWPSSEVTRFSNTDDGIAQLVASLESLEPTIVAYEPMGPMSRPLVDALAGAGLTAAAVNPYRIRSFARAVSRLSKTDRLDAITIAEFAGTIRPTPTVAPNKEEKELHDLVGRRRQLTEILRDEKIRIAHADSEDAVSSIERHQEWVVSEMRQIDELIDQTIESRLDWSEKRALLMTFNGVGPVVSAALVADLPELGLLDRGKIASLVGLAPIASESGTKIGTRRIKGGRRRVRNALFMCSVATMRSNEKLKTYYWKLRDSGKPPKVARVAVMRKMLVMLNAMVRDHATWDPGK